jgi:DNA-directed RNA polymerase specialized sigma54-like protein
LNFTGRIINYKCKRTGRYVRLRGYCKEWEPRFDVNKSDGEWALELIEMLEDQGHTVVNKEEIKQRVSNKSSEEKSYEF